MASHVESLDVKELANRFPEHRIIVDNKNRHHHPSTVAKRSTGGNRENPTIALGLASLP
jgi:hypothetical protein